MCPPTGAIADNFVQITSHLSHFCEVSVICPDYLDFENSHFQKKYSLTYSRKNPFSIFNWVSLKTLLKIRKDKFDTVFFFDQNVINVFFNFFCSANTKIMWWHEPSSSGRHTFINGLIYSCNDYFMTRISQKIIIGGESLKDKVPQFLHHKLEVVPLPFLEKFSIETPINNNPKQNVDLVFFGNIEIYKGLDILAQSLEILYEQNVYVSLYILGGGDINSKAPIMLNLSKKFPERIVLFNNYQPYSKIVECIQSSRAVILPYLSATGTNTVSIAYRYSKPIIATKTGSFKDYVFHGKTGVLAEPGDPHSLAEAIKSIMLNFEQAEKLGKNAYNFYSLNFTQDSVTKKLINLFSRCNKIVGY